MDQVEMSGCETDDQFWESFFEALYTSDRVKVAEQTSVQQWLSCAEPKMLAWKRPVFRAIMGGYYADRVAYGFLAGYQSALRNRFVNLPERGLVAFCVSEKGGAKPTAFKTLGTPQQNSVLLNGKKTFVTCGDQAEILLIAYKAAEQASGLPLIHIARIAANAPGVTIENLPEMPFIPEVSRGSVTLVDAVVDANHIYTGDCYLDYSKPFSASEGYFIIASVIGYLLRIAGDYQWPVCHTDELVSLLQFTVLLSECDPLDPKTIIAGNGLRQSLQAWAEKTKDLWRSASPSEQAHWLRDGAILFASDKSQQIRLSKARAYYKTV